MIIADKTIFVHIPKCAGNLVHQAFRSLGVKHKRFSRAHISLSSIEYPDDYKVYGIIRNPYAWYVSWYHYSKKHNTIWWQEFNRSDKIDGSFKSVLYEMLQGKSTSSDINKEFITKHSWKKPFRPFWAMHLRNIGWYSLRVFHISLKNYREYLSDLEFKPKFGVDQYIKIEEIQEKLPEIFNNRFGNYEENKVRSILNTKINSSKHDHYSKYYDDDMVEWVKNKDSWVIEKFDYRFEGSITNNVG